MPALLGPSSSRRTVTAGDAPEKGGPAIDTGPGATYHLTMSVVRKRRAVSGTIGATEFKARCLELMDLVAATGNPVVITKRGKPVAKLVPVQERPRSIVGALKGHARIRGDIVSPVEVRWDASD